LRPPIWLEFGDALIQWLSHFSVQKPAQIELGQVVIEARAPRVVPADSTWKWVNRDGAKEELHVARVTACGKHFIGETQYRELIQIRGEEARELFLAMKNGPIEYEAGSTGSERVSPSSPSPTSSSVAMSAAEDESGTGSERV